MAGYPGVFQCKRCAFAAPVSVKLGAEEQRTEKDAARASRDHLALVRCPLCGRARSYARLAVTCLFWAVLIALPLSLVALMTVIFSMLPRCVNQPPPQLRFLFAALVVAVLLAGNMRSRWNKTIATAVDAVELRRFWEWRLPAGPRVVAVQDPASGTDAVWIDGARAAASEDAEYVVPLVAAAEGPYRASQLQATLRFPADGTCWLTVGGKRIEPVRTSPDVV